MTTTVDALPRPFYQHLLIDDFFRDHGVTLQAQKLFELVVAHACDGIARIPLARYAQLMGRSVSSVKRYLAELADARAIAKRQRHVRSGGSACELRVLMGARPEPGEGVLPDAEGLARGLTDELSGEPTTEPSINPSGEYDPATVMTSPSAGGSSPEVVDELIEECSKDLSIDRQAHPLLRKHLEARLGRYSEGDADAKLRRDVRALRDRARKTGRNPAAVFVAAVRSNDFRSLAVPGSAHAECEERRTQARAALAKKAEAEGQARTSTHEPDETQALLRRYREDWARAEAQGPPKKSLTERLAELLGRNR